MPILHMPRKAWMIVLIVEANPVVTPGAVEVRGFVPRIFVFLGRDNIVPFQLGEPLTMFLRFVVGFTFMNLDQGCDE